MGCLRIPRFPEVSSQNPQPGGLWDRKSDGLGPVLLRGILGQPTRRGGGGVLVPKTFLQTAMDLVIFTILGPWQPWSAKTLLAVNQSVPTTVNQSVPTLLFRYPHISSPIVDLAKDSSQQRRQDVTWTSNPPLSKAVKPDFENVLCGLVEIVHPISKDHKTPRCDALAY